MGAETMLWASDATWGAETIRCLGEGPASRWVNDLHCSSVPMMMDVVMDVGMTYIASWSPLMTDGRGNDLVGGVDDMGEGKVE